MAEELEFTNEATETIYLSSSFESTSNKLQKVGVATVHVIADNRQMIPVRVLIVPTISTPISNRLQHAVSFQILVLPSLLLISADFYCDLIEDHVVRGNGPTSVKSKIGYLLSGPIQAQNHRGTAQIFNIMASHLPKDV